MKFTLNRFILQFPPILLSLFFGLLDVQDLNAQCYPDRHNTTATNSWLTCEPTQSLNAERGMSHWILYDLGQVMEMGKMHFWNLNHPELLDQGAKTLVIDYSTDGVIWEEWGTLDLEMAEASGFYEGSEVADLERLRTRMLLFTIIENHGGDCYGFAEVRVETFMSLNDEGITKDDVITLSPNPAIDQTRLLIKSELVGAASIKLINVLGQEVYGTTLNLTGGEQIVDLDLSGLVASNYFVKVTTPSKEWVEELSILSR